MWTRATRSPSSSPSRTSPTAPPPTTSCLRDTIPVGFALPDEPDVTVTDGTGAVLDSSGDLFDPTGGLTIQDPIAPFSDTSGANVLLVTFTLQATANVALPLATVTDSAQIVSYAASEGGPNLAGSAAPGSLLATTPVQTGDITVSSAADQPAGLLEPGHTDSFDITVTLPEGTVNDLRISEVLPQVGSAYLQLVGVEIEQFGANLSATAPVAVEPDGTIALGNVTNTPDNVETAADQITLRVTVEGAGTTSGTGTLQTVVSADDPNSGNGTWSTSVTNTVQLDKPDTPPTIGGISANQNATSTMAVLPFAGLLLTDPDAGQVETLTVHLSNPALGALTGPAAVTTNATATSSSPAPSRAVQAAARTLLFQPNAGATGTEAFALSLDDGYGGVASNAATTVSVATAGDTSAIPQFPLSTTQTILTSTATGTSTVDEVQTYGGTLTGITGQFVYDGSTPLAVVALAVEHAHSELWPTKRPSRRSAATTRSTFAVAPASWWAAPATTRSCSMRRSNPCPGTRSSTSIVATPPRSGASPMAPRATIGTPAPARRTTPASRSAWTSTATARPTPA